jgi:hypothetical protein
LLLILGFLVSALFLDRLIVFILEPDYIRFDGGRKG